MSTHSKGLYPCSYVFVCLVLVLFSNLVSRVPAQYFEPYAYNTGTPVLQDIWVDPVSGNDANDGLSSSTALRTLTEAWGRIPANTELSPTGYRIRLMAGDYGDEHVPGWMADRWGTASCPVILEGEPGARIHRYLDINNCRYLYLLNLSVVTDPGIGGGGNVIHLASCDHVLLRGCTLNGFDGAIRQPQETLKVNQTSNLYVEQCDISGAFWYALDYVAVQGGHIIESRIHDCDQWALLLKGGTAGLRVENNEIHGGGVGGIVAGNGTGFEFMRSPWIHYEAYDLKIVNNYIHDCNGAGLGVNGGYNILMAYNTLYRVGANSHAIEVVQGMRSCDGDTAACAANNAAGGWGGPGVDGQFIPNRNVYICNNLLYNPSGYQSAWSHFQIAGPVTPPDGCNVASPARSDDNLVIRGYLIWNGPADLPLGIDGGSGCQPDNPTCSETLLRDQNAINTVEPQLVAPESGNVRPVAGGNVFEVSAWEPSDFPGNDRPSPPLAPQGVLVNTVPRDRDLLARVQAGPPGAYLASDQPSPTPTPTSTQLPGPTATPTPAPQPTPTPAPDAPDEVLLLITGAIASPERTPAGP